MQLDKADHQYKLLQSHKAALDSLLVAITDHSTDRHDDAVSGSSGPATGQGSSTPQPSSGSSSSAPSASTSAINKNIQLLAQKYCGDCRSAFEELSKIIQVQGRTKFEILTSSRET